MLYRIHLEVNKDHVLDLLQELQADKRVLRVVFQKEKRAYTRRNGNGNAEESHLLDGTTAEVDAIVLKALRLNGGRTTHSYVLRQLKAQGITAQSLDAALQKTDRYHQRGKILRLGGAVATS